MFLPRTGFTLTNRLDDDDDDAAMPETSTVDLRAILPWFAFRPGLGRDDAATEETTISFEARATEAPTPAAGGLGGLFGPSAIGGERPVPVPDVNEIARTPAAEGFAIEQAPGPYRAAGALVPNGAVTETAGSPSPEQVASYDGTGQVIIVIDDGTSPFYDQSNTIWSFDFTGQNDRDASVNTIDSHGSWVAQTALDEAEGAGIIHLKVFPDNGGGASISDIEEALRFSEVLAGVFDVAAVNLSLGFGNATQETLTPLSDEFARLDDLGVISVAAAGNDGEEFDDGVNVISADPNVISVAAVDQSGNLAGFSQTSDTLVDVAATGVGVQVETTTGSVGFVSGTSFAAPEISGIAARLSQASWELLGEDLTDEELIDILNATGTEVGGADVPYLEADGDAAVAYFIENLALYDDDPFIA
ncbi:MAG: S8/S53 family peptidase [Pseudomonadota bacterium]